jgi:two-component system sensor histidine kinase KdpD
VPVDELVGSTLTRMESALADRPVHVDIAEDVPLLRVDPVVFEHVFVNLLENAVKYTPPGSPIDWRVWAEGDAVHLELADRGPGLEPAEREAVFEKFVRGAHRSGAGAGLGLAICRGIVEAHGGTIRADNRTGGGAAFHIVLPVGEQPPPVPETKGDAP